MNAHIHFIRLTGRQWLKWIQAQVLSISISLFRSGVLRRWGDKRTTYTIISPAPCTRRTGKSEGFAGDFMSITSQGEVVLWVLEVSVTYSDLITTLHFLVATPEIHFLCLQNESSTAVVLAVSCLVLEVAWGLFLRKGRKGPLNSSQCYQITSGCLL